MKIRTMPVLLLGVLLAIPSMAMAEDEFPKFEEITKDCETISGFVTLYYNQKEDKLFAAVPVGQKFFIADSISGGGAYTGWQWSEGVYYFERFDKQLVLMEADTRYSPGNGTVGDVIRRTYTDRIVTTIPIRTMQGGNPVINLADLFKKDFGGIGRLYGMSLNSSLSQWKQIKNFPQNTNIQVEVAMMRNGQGLLGQVYYSISALPSNHGFKPRQADDRVGYFMTATKDWSTPHDKKTIFKRHIHRWNLQKADPSAELSDVTPETQIVFYLEKTIPKKYRRYVREGILEWNKAFEKAGFRNAVAVFQQTDEMYTDIHPEDVRYNFIRWIVSGRAYAMGPSRVNPYTGEILDADIVVDDSMIRSFITDDYTIRGPKAYAPFQDDSINAIFDNPSRKERLIPEGKGCKHDKSHELLCVDNLCESHAKTLETEKGFEVHDAKCDCGRAMTRKLAMMATAHAAATGTRDLPEEFIGQAIKETVMHEVGHTLGLKHNFKASTWKTLEEIQATPPGEPVTASVMDYNPYNYALAEDKQGTFASSTLGPYDYWAIEYGYRMPHGELGSEDKLLEAILSRSGEPELVYSTDEDTSMFSPDPFTWRFDNGKDPVAFMEHEIALFQKYLPTVMEWGVKDGESYSRLRKTVNLMLNNCGFGAMVACRLPGGINITRLHKGDCDTSDPVTPVSAELHQSLLDSLEKNLIGPDSFQFSPELLNHLGAGRWRHWGTQDYDSWIEYTIHDQMLDIQAMPVTLLLYPNTVERLYETSMLVDTDEAGFAVPDLYAGVSKIVWSELDNSRAKSVSNRKPMIESFRRNLQRRHLGILIDQVVGRQNLRPDCRSIARLSLTDLEKRIADVLKKNDMRMDDYTRAHLEACSHSARKALDANYQL